MNMDSFADTSQEMSVEAREHLDQLIIQARQGKPFILGTCAECDSYVNLLDAEWGLCGACQERKN